MLTTLETWLTTVMANTNVLIDICRKTAIENGDIPKLPSGSNSKPADSDRQKFHIGKYLSWTLRESRNAGTFTFYITRKLYPELFVEGQVMFE